MIIDTNKLIVPNWFNKLQTEDVVDEKLTSQKFKEFKEYLQKTEIFSDISDLLFNYYQEFKETRTDVQK